MAGTRGYQTGKHLEAFILLLIAQEPLHGGLIIARLKDLLPDNWTIDDGHVYRMLRNLESEHVLTSNWVSEDVGAPVRVYRLGEFGRARLDSWKDDISLRVKSLQKFLRLWTTIFNDNG